MLPRAMVSNETLLTEAVSTVRERTGDPGETTEVDVRTGETDGATEAVAVAVLATVTEGDAATVGDSVGDSVGDTVATGVAVTVIVKDGTAVATDVGTPTTMVAVPLAIAITGVVATTAADVDVPCPSVMMGAVATGDTLANADAVTAGVAVAITCPDAPETGPSPPTMLAMTSTAGTASRNKGRMDLDIAGSLKVSGAR